MLKRDRQVFSCHPSFMRHLPSLLFEISSLRQIQRSHAQSLVHTHFTDTIAAHSHLVSVIAFFLAEASNADIGKVLTMALFHDMTEARAGDQNWIHRRYVTVHEDEILEDIATLLPEGSSLIPNLHEYDQRESMEAKVVKDADIIAQLILIKEYSATGHAEAQRWLEKDKMSVNIKTDAGKTLWNELKDVHPQSWQDVLTTNKNRKG